MSTNKTSPVMDLALVAVFAALIAAFSLAPAVPLPGNAVPITLQTLAVALTAMIIGPWRGAAATLLYLVVGFAGLPVFAQGASTIAVLARPSAGYLISFPIYAIVVGLLARYALRRTNWKRPALLVVAGLVGSFLVVHPLGILGMARNIPIALDRALVADIAFWPGDLVKTVVAALIATAVHKAFPALAARRRVSATSTQAA
ncbi:biotin transporter BioY [Propionibacteriaceae bacterium Y1923]|uniref:biotin transporter BioY n=1 Tax=Aestuariimicrobium sp. Y1814 TaxID=3418742 RepID=UPI003C2602F0